MRIDLSLEQKRRLALAMEQAMDQADLDVMLLQRTGRSLANTVALPQRWQIIPPLVIAEAWRKGWTDELILGAAAHVPEDSAFAQLAMELGLSAAGSNRLSMSPSVSAGLAANSLQGLVSKASSLQDVATFIATLTRLQSQVCRIERAGAAPQALGTGFLIGNDVVMTNKHVLDLIRPDHGAIQFRFDYRSEENGLTVHPGFAVGLGATWLVAEKPYAPSDLREGGSQPTPSDLDYAVLRLAQPVGKFPPGADKEEPGGSSRGFIRLNGAELPAVGKELFILQHPAGQPLKLAVGQVTGWVPDGNEPLRVRHDATTEYGSSGSPCLNGELKIVALHHATDPRDPRAPKFNQAIPIGRIAPELRTLQLL